MRACAARVGLYCLRLIVASQVRACRDACRRGLPSIVHLTTYLTYLPYHFTSPTHMFSCLRSNQFIVEP